MKPESKTSPLSATAAATNPLIAEGLGVAVERHLRGYFAAHKGELPARGLYDRIIQEVERPLLALTLSACKANQVKAAQLLGLNRNTLRKKIRELEIKVARPRRRRKVTAPDEAGEH